MTAVTAYRSTGSGVAPGTAVAPLWRADRPLPATVEVHPDDVGPAFTAVAADLDRLADRARADGRSAAADIVAVGALIATDVMLVDDARSAVAGAGDPLQALLDAVERHARAIEELPDRCCGSGPPTSGRSGGGSPIGWPAPGSTMAGRAGRSSWSPPRSARPTCSSWLGQGLAAAVAVRGGANSHAAIVARSAGLPLVIGVDPGVLDLPDGTSLLVEADAGGGLSWRTGRGRGRSRPIRRYARRPAGRCSPPSAGSRT